MGTRIENTMEKRMKLPENASKRYKVPMYVDGITISSNVNVAVRLFKRKGKEYVGYFDENHIYTIDSIENIEKKNLELKNLLYYYNYFGKTYFIGYYFGFIFPNNCERNTVLDKAIYKELNEGDPASKLHEIAERVYLKEGCSYDEFDRKFHSIERPIIIGDKKHFDYIKISVKCASTVTKEDIVQNKARLDEWVIGKLQKNSSFLKYNVPISILELSNIVLTRDKRLEYTFAVKKELRELM